MADNCLQGISLKNYMGIQRFGVEECFSSQQLTSITIDIQYTSVSSASYTPTEYLHFKLYNIYGDLLGSLTNEWLPSAAQINTVDRIFFNTTEFGVMMGGCDSSKYKFHVFCDACDDEDFYIIHPSLRSCPFALYMNGSALRVNKTAPYKIDSVGTQIGYELEYSLTFDCGEYSLYFVKNIAFVSYVYVNRYMQLHCNQ